MRAAFRDPDRRSLLLAAALGLFSLGAVQAAYGPAFPWLLERHGVGLDRVGDVVVVHFAGALSATFASAWLLVRFGYPPILRTAAAVATTGVVTAALAPSWPLLLLGAALAGTGFGLMNTSFNVLVARVFTPNAAPQLNLLSATFGLGAVAGPLVVAWLGGSLRGPLLLLAATTAVTGLAVLRVAAPEPASPAGPGRPPWLAAVGFALLYALYVGLESGVASWETVHLEPHLGAARAALFTSAFWATLTIGRLVAIPFSSLLRPRDLVLGASAASLALLATAHVQGFAPWAYVLAGLAFSPIFPTTLAWIERVFPRRSERIVPLALGVAGFGPMASTALIGALAARSGPPVIPTVLSGLAALLLVVVAALWRGTRRA